MINSLRKLKHRLVAFWAMTRAIGVPNTLMLLSRERASKSDGFSLQLRGVQHPIFLRTPSSDSLVFRQIFVEQEYKSLCALDGIKTIVDCGANVGYSSVYFANQFPECQVVAVEPEAGNFLALSKNTSPYQTRVSLEQAGIWEKDAALAVRTSGFRDSLNWSTQVVEASADDSDTIDGVCLPTLFDRHSIDSVDILKMDIEGAEAVVFAGNYRQWLPRVRMLVVELHDDSCFGPATDLVTTALLKEGFTVSRAGELHIFKRDADAT